MTPFTIIDLLVQVQITVQQLHSKVISFQLPSGFLLFGTLRAAMAEQQEAAGLCGAEVKGDRACLLGVPLRQGYEGLRGLKGDRVQGCHVLAAEHQVTVQGDFRVALNGQP
uniref:Uncharacterized protein n=1 Tax=Monopterus albus TaxID=43700 RepID=A0A3Q3IL84_MONAL